MKEIENLLFLGEDLIEILKRASGLDRLVVNTDQAITGLHGAAKETGLKHGPASVERLVWKKQKKPVSVL